MGGLLAQEVTSTEPEGQDLRAQEQVHPNEEQLMRIWDIGHDARLIAEIPATQMETFRAQFSLIDSVREDEAVVAQEVAATEGITTALDTGSRLAADDRQFDEDARTETTDPVGDALGRYLVYLLQTMRRMTNCLESTVRNRGLFLHVILFKWCHSGCTVPCLLPLSRRFCQTSLLRMVVPAVA
ncbi:hypothetical protein EDB84DRAFT_49720 [Lactarius hengduanensis]|nr:hypothetical protein EDB84DRAFT_49720 [Lactarius hengduanensis]